MSSCGGDRRVPKPKIYTSGSLLKKVYTVGPVGKSASVSIAFLLHKRKMLIREADEFYCAVCKLCLIEAVKNKNVSAMGVIMPHKGSEQMLNKRHVDQHAEVGSSFCCSCEQPARQVGSPFVHPHAMLESRPGRSPRRRSPDGTPRVPGLASETPALLPAQGPAFEVATTGHVKRDRKAEVKRRGEKPVCVLVGGREFVQSLFFSSPVWFQAV